MVGCSGERTAGLAPPPAPSYPQCSTHSRSARRDYSGSRGDRLVVQQGVTPEQVALTIALGLVIGVFPIIGATTILYPAQLVTLIPFYRAGESLFNRPHLPLSIPMLMDRFRDDAGKYFSDFGIVAVYGIVVWCLIAPIVVAAIYYVTRPSLRVLAQRTRLSRAA